MLPSRRVIFSASNNGAKNADNKVKEPVIAKSTESSPIITKNFGDENSKTTIYLTGDKIIIKGNDGATQSFEISMKSLKDTLRRLRSHHSVLIKDLRGDLAKDFETIKNYVNLMHQSNAEQMINEPIIEIFGDLKKGVFPGTVGAYMNGCNLTTNHKGNPSCAAVCVGSKQPDSSIPGHSPCAYLTLLHTPKGFIALNSPASKKDAQIVVKEGEQTSFSKDQVDELRSFGIERVKVIAYSDDGVTYREISPEFVGLQHVQKADTVELKPQPVKRDVPQNQSSSGFWVLLIVVIIIIVLLAVLSKKNGSNSFGAMSSSMFDVNLSPY
jgi:hypothetical protein